MLRSPRRWLCALLFVGGGCFSESFGDGSQSGGTGDTIGTAGESAGCVPGAETCPCMEGGLCDAGLICASQLCVDLGGGSDPTSVDPDDSGEGGGTAKTTDDGGEDGSSGAGTGDTGMIGEPGSCVDHCGESVPHFDGMCFCDPVCASSGDCCPDYAAACGGGCAFNSDCADTEVCSVGTSTCIDSFSATYDIVVDQWTDHTPVCWDGVGNCLADVYYEVYYGGDPVFTSVTFDDTLNASWTDPWTVVLDPALVLTFAFFDDDTLGDESIDTECFVQGDGTCGPVPASVLHAGTVLWDPGDDTFTVQVRFSAR